MKKTFRIPDMHCSACVMRLEGIEDKLAGIRHVSASFHRQQMEVDWDETQVSEKDILTAIQKMGYHVSADL